MKNRLQQIMYVKNLTASNLAKILMIQPSNISHILNGRNNPNLQFIQKLMTAFPDINPKWLINGEEPMFTGEPVKHSITQQEPLAEETNAKIVDEPDTITLVSNENPIDQIKNQNSDKRISRIVIFYTDRSFVDYRPE